MLLRWIAGTVAILVGVVAYVPYLRKVAIGISRPHAFSWFVWGILTAIVFSGQIAGGAGIGASTTGLSVIVCFVIFALAISKGERDFPVFDWLCMIGAGLALLLWYLTDDPLLAIILITTIDLLAFVPTFRKAYFDPRGEPVLTFALSGLKFLIGLFALQELSAVTLIYPLAIVASNWVFVAMLVSRRRSSPEAEE
jgi:hypothetical protein